MMTANSAQRFFFFLFTADFMFHRSLLLIAGGVCGTGGQQADICNNACSKQGFLGYTYVSNGVCEDGGPGAESGGCLEYYETAPTVCKTFEYDCDFGDDCADCGPRQSALSSVSMPPPPPSPPPPRPPPPDECVPNQYPHYRECKGAFQVWWVLLGLLAFLPLAIAIPIYRRVFRSTMGNSRLIELQVQRGRDFGVDPNAPVVQAVERIQGV